MGMSFAVYRKDKNTPFLEDGLNRRSNTVPLLHPVAAYDSRGKWAGNVTEEQARDFIASHVACGVDPDTLFIARVPSIDEPVASAPVVIPPLIPSIDNTILNSIEGGNK